MKVMYKYNIHIDIDTDYGVCKLVTGDRLVLLINERLLIGG